MGILDSGACFGKYGIVRQIGRGGMGVVYLAEDGDLGRRVALKVLDRGLTAGPDFEERFRQEARLVAGLEHRGIVQIHNLVRVGADLAIDMAYVERGSLDDAVSKGGLTVHQALCWARDVLDALACCHEAGIVHRDVKPSNILLASDGRALLSDFGLAKLLVSHQTSSILTKSTASLFVGTPQYAPPESWDGQEPAPAWDVYSVGMVLYEAIAGGLPYDAQTPFSLIKQMIERPVPPLAEAPADVSAALSSAVDGMTAREVARRPQNAGEALELLNALPELGGAEQERAKGQKLKPKPKRRLRPITPGPSPAVARSRWVALGVAAFVAAGLLLAGIYGMTQLQGGAAPDSAETAAGKQALSSELGNEPWALFDTIDATSQEAWPAHWLMLRAEEAGAWEVVASESTRLWSIQASDEDGATLSLGGHWAEYADETAHVFRHGSLTGVGRWLTLGRQMSVALEFRSAQDGARWTRSFLLQRSEGNATPSEFVRRLDASDCVPSLICNELIPRRLAWAESVEQCLAQFSGALVTVPRLSADAGGIKVDGLLDEPEWRLGPLSGGDLPGHLSGRGPQGAASFLMMRYGDAGLYVALRTPAAVERPQLSLGLLGLVSVPTRFSPRWSALIEEDRIVASRHLRRGELRSWDCSWQVAGTVSGGTRQWELFIPFGDETLSSPRAGDRWRFNCLLASALDSNGDNGAKDPPLVWWGDAEPERLEHGAVLVFGNKDVFGET